MLFAPPPEAGAVSLLAPLGPEVTALTQGRGFLINLPRDRCLLPSWLCWIESKAGEALGEAGALPLPAWTRHQGNPASLTTGYRLTRNAQSIPASPLKQCNWGRGVIKSIQHFAPPRSSREGTGEERIRGVDQTGSPGASQLPVLPSAISHLLCAALRYCCLLLLPKLFLPLPPGAGSPPACSLLPSCSPGLK